MTFNQRLALLVAAAIAITATVECAIQGWHALMRYVDRNVARMVDDGLAALATTDDDFAEYADPDPYDWSADTLHAWADRATPTFRNPCANNPAAVDALAAAEASRADWSEVARWSR